MTPQQWLHALELRRAETVIDVPGGQAIRHSAFPKAHDHNKLILTSEVDGAAAAAAADEALHGLEHRLIELHEPLESVEAGLLAAGYECNRNLLMGYVGTGSRSSSDIAVVELTLPQRIAAAEKDWQESLPQADPDVWRQLGERITTVVNAADATFLGVRNDGGELMAYCDLYRYEGMAQIENVFTYEAFRGHGHASALILEGIVRAQDDAVFLVADADDWPRKLYERLGFQDLVILPTYAKSAS